MLGKIKYLLVFVLLGYGISYAQEGSNHGFKFEQLGPMLPSPNEYRNMDGAPGPKYWQQKCDYDIQCTLDPNELRLDGQEKITYYNNSPNTLRYLWLQLDENEHAAGADNLRSDPSSLREVMSESALKNLESWKDREKYGHKIKAVKAKDGSPLNYLVNKTMMRIDLPKPLAPNETFSFSVDWHYYLTDRMSIGGRGGYEYFEDEDNYIFTITQWYPRLCVYSDFEGWQNKQFTGRGEFALTFGDFNVEMTLPDDYVVGSTGECQNYPELLSAAELERWKAAKDAAEPLKIVTLAEAKTNAAGKKSKTKKTWKYKAENVRDFAWTASRKFVWDAMPHITEEGKKVMCMSYYPEESYPIYSKYSTKTVVHTLDVYSRYSIPYPYPVAISVEAANGMEYPMICFNYGRAAEDGTYTERAKYGAIGVIIHEVGHNYFPMIINSDERQWTWFDEGINTFVQFLAEQEIDPDYPSRRGPAHKITGYMDDDPSQLEPIMTNSENIVQFGNNAYAKPATALNILRETIMGRELFDYAFKEYCRRWAFKHPTPADFFRTMEDASAVDLDWFWRGWFYSIDNVDISIDSIKWFQADLKNDPVKRKVPQTIVREKPFEHISKIRNKEEKVNFLIDRDTSLIDYYTDYEPWSTEDSILTYEVDLFEETLSKKEKKEYKGKNYYELYFSNKGGLVMPLILEWTFEDGTKEIERIPVEVWRKNEDKFRKVFVKDKVVDKVKLDPYKELADVDESNNSWPVQEEQPSRFQIFKSHKFPDIENPMQKAKKKKLVKP